MELVELSSANGGSAWVDPNEVAAVDGARLTGCYGSGVQGTRITLKSGQRVYVFDLPDDTVDILLGRA